MNMGYRLEAITMQQVKERCHDYPYALLYMRSELIFTEASVLKDVQWDECMEARFFGKRGEIYICMDGNEMTCREIRDDGEEDSEGSNQEVFKLDRRFQHLGSKLVVKRYIGYDEDGQANVKLTRLADVI